MKPLNDDEKKEIVDKFIDLESAIKAGGDVNSAFSAFQSTYRGDSRAYVEAFHEATDQRGWAGQLRMYLEGEIGSSFWPAEKPLQERCPECGEIGVGSPMGSTFQGSRWQAQIFTCPNQKCGNSWAEGEGDPVTEDSN